MIPPPPNGIHHHQIQQMTSLYEQQNKRNELVNSNNINKQMGGKQYVTDLPYRPSQPPPQIPMQQQQLGSIYPPRTDSDHLNSILPLVESVLTIGGVNQASKESMKESIELERAGDMYNSEYVYNVSKSGIKKSPPPMPSTAMIVNKQMHEELKTKLNISPSNGQSPIKNNGFAKPAHPFYMDEVSSPQQPVINTEINKTSSSVKLMQPVETQSEDRPDSVSVETRPTEPNRSISPNELNQVSANQR